MKRCFGHVAGVALQLILIGSMSIPVKAQEEKPAQQSDSEDSGKYARCAPLRADIGANIPDAIAAGGEPTLAQMSKLMDNPVGNVAMLFNQVDAYRLEHPHSKQSENKYN